MPQGQFGVEDILIDQKLLLEEILKQLRIAVMHLTEITGDTIEEQEVHE